MSQPDSSRALKRPWLQFSLKTFLLLPLFAFLAAMAYRQWYEPWAYQQSRIVPTAWDLKSGKNVLWSVPLGSQSYGNVVVSGGMVFIGTNNEGLRPPGESVSEMKNPSMLLNVLPVYWQYRISLMMVVPGSRNAT